jgi:hypothetical protein
MRKNEEQVREFFEQPVFGGNAIVSDDMKSIEIANVTVGDFTMRYIGDVAMAIIGGKELLERILPERSGTALSISGWSIDGLDESNLGLLQINSHIEDNSGAMVILDGITNSSKIGAAYIFSDDNSLIIGQDGYKVCFSEHLWRDSFVENGAFDWDSFIKDPLVNDLNTPLVFDIERADRILSSFKSVLPCRIWSNDSSVRTLVAEISLDAFQIARYGKDELYRIVEQKFSEEGIEIEIDEMEMRPTSIDGDAVVYECFPTDFVIKEEENIFPDDEDEDFDRNHDDAVVFGSKP